MVSSLIPWPSFYLNNAFLSPACEVGAVNNFSAIFMAKIGFILARFG
jgi:hypothetical protein